MKRVEKGKYLKFSIYCIVVVLLNIAGITFFFRADLTENKVYSLSAASKKVVATLSEPLTVKVFFNSNLPAPYNNIERYLHDLLEEYAIAGNRYFNYQFHDVSGGENDEAARNQELARSYGIHPVQIQNIEQDEVKFQNAYMGMALIHGDMIESMPAVTSTDQLEYQITSAVRKMNNKISALLRLQDTVSVKLILSSSLRAVGPYMNISGLLELPSRIEEIVKKLNDKNFGKLAFYTLDPSASAADAQEMQKYHVLRLNWDEFRDRRGRTVAGDSGYAGIVVEHGSKFESIELIEVIRLPIFGTQYQLTDLADLEKKIDDALGNVIHVNEEIGYLAGHGTLPIIPGPPMMGQDQDSLSAFNKLLSGEYSIQEVSLKEGGIPEGLSTLIIAGPKENFSDYELYRLDQYLMKGKNLALFIDSFTEVTPQGRPGMMNQMQKSFWVPLHTGLEKLLAHYGISVRSSIVLDENSFKQKMPRQFGGGEQQIYFAPIIKNELINKGADYLRNIKGLVMLESSPVDVDEQTARGNSLDAVKLFSSSERSWEMKDRIDLNPMLITPPRDDEKFASFPLAYMVEGTFPSYFADKPVPEKGKEGDTDADEEKGKDMKDEGIDMSAVRSEGVTINKGKDAKIFIIGTSEILKDNVIDEEGKTPNAQFVMNVIDYLNNREDIAVMRSKTQRFNPLGEVGPAVRTAVKSVNIAGLPILIIIAGVVVWGRRASRKRMIQKMFIR